MSRSSPLSGLGRWDALALVLLAFAFAYPMQVNGYNQNAHYALVRALADGTPAIDRTRYEVGDLGTGDVTERGSHVYSNKAPGLALATLPAFFAVEAVGMRTTGDPTRVIWALHLLGIVVPALVLLILVRAVAEWVEPGYGTAAAITLGLATLVLPFGTLFFAHVPSAALAFAAFAVLWRERRGPPSLWLLGLGGALAGLGVTTEYSVLLACAVLGAYALARSGRARRGLAYLAGVVTGLVPLLLFDTWAFGWPAHLSLLATGKTQTETDGGIVGFDLGFPRPGVAFDLLFSAWGLLVVTPVLACSVFGAVSLYRRGLRAEALVLLGIPALLLIFNAGLRPNAFGGQGYPRYLIDALPFLAVPLAASYRGIPLTTIALALVSAFQMTVVTATNPLAAYDGDWLSRLTSKDFSQTGASVVAITGWYSIAPYFVAVLIVASIAALSIGAVRLSRRDAFLTLLALLGWALIAVQGENPAGREFSPDYVGTMVACVGIVVVAFVGMQRLVVVEDELRTPVREGSSTAPPGSTRRG